MRPWRPVMAQARKRAERLHSLPLRKPKPCCSISNNTDENNEQRTRAIWGAILRKTPPRCKRKVRNLTKRAVNNQITTKKEHEPIQQTLHTTGQRGRIHRSSATDAFRRIE